MIDSQGPELFCFGVGATGLGIAFASRCTREESSNLPRDSLPEHVGVAGSEVEEESGRGSVGQVKPAGRGVGRGESGRGV